MAKDFCAYLPDLATAWRSLIRGLRRGSEINAEMGGAQTSYNLQEISFYRYLSFFYDCKTSVNYVQLCMHVYNSSLREIKPILIKHYIQLN